MRKGIRLVGLNQRLVAFLFITKAIRYASWEEVECIAGLVSSLGSRR